MAHNMKKLLSSKEKIEEVYEDFR